MFADHLTNPALPDEKKRHYADRIRSQLNQLEQQVRDILIFSKGGVVLDQVVASADLAQRLGDQLRDLCSQHKAECRLDIELPLGAIRCNPELLVSAFNNLVENAIQACRNQKIVPVLTLVIRHSNDTVIEITLMDNGPGIPAALADKILEPFFTTKSTGTGLGLAVVKTIVESHGGSFVIGSRSSGGATAAITLPLLQQI